MFTRVLIFPCSSPIIHPLAFVPPPPSSPALTTHWHTLYTQAETRTFLSRFEQVISANLQHLILRRIAARPRERPVMRLPADAASGARTQPRSLSPAASVARRERLRWPESEGRDFSAVSASIVCSSGSFLMCRHPDTLAQAHC